MDILKLNIDQTEPVAPTESETRVQVALLASIAATACALVARFVFGAPLVPELLAQFIFAVSPIWLVELAVGLLGPFAKHLAFLGCVALYVIALAAAAAAFLKYFSARGKNNRALWPAGFALLTWSITILVIAPLLGGGIAGRYLQQGPLVTSISLLIVHAVYGAVIGWLPRLFAERPEVASRDSLRLDRRRLIRGVWYAVIAVGVYDIGRSLLQSWIESGSGRVSGGNGVFPNIDGLAREITPTEDFYTVSKNPFDPQVEARSWRLDVAGLVEEPLSFTYEDFKSLPSVEQYATLACISNTVGGDLIGNALWRGARLKDVLERARLKPGVVDIVLRASDGYSDSIPLDRAMAEATLLVYEMNNAPLTSVHGFPLRLIVPGIYGMKNVKWITRIEAVDYDFKGYWQARGWDDRAEYQTMSRIDAPVASVRESATIAGIAFAGDRSISKVEVSTDGGKTWEQAEIKPALSAYSWTLWHKQWSPPQPGKYSLVVRATDGRAVTQTSQYAPPAPSGSTGYHRLSVESEK